MFRFLLQDNNKQIEKKQLSFKRWHVNPDPETIAFVN